MQITIVERKRGVSSWVKMGPTSLEILVDCLVLCIKDLGKGKWERNWKENGRFYSLVLDVNKGGCFLRLGVVDLENKRFSIFIPKGKGAKGGWASMVEALRSMDATSEMRESKKAEVLSSKPLLGKTFAEVVRHPRNGEKTVARVEVCNKDISRNVDKLAHCLVGFWDLISGRGDDLRCWGTQMAKTWGLKGNLGLAKLERGKALMEFEILAETEKVLKLGKISSRETGCQLEGERKGEAWVRIVGLPVSLWDQAILRRVGEECGGFLAIDSQTEKMEELQWARILVKLKGKELPNAVEIWVEEECYTLTLWWEVRPILKSSPAGKKGKIIRTEGKVEGEGVARASKRVRMGDGDSSPKALLQPVDGTWAQRSGLGGLVDQPRGPVRVPTGLLGGVQGLGGPIKPGLPEGSFLGLGPDGPLLSFSSPFEAGPSSSGLLRVEESGGPSLMRQLLRKGVVSISTCASRCKRLGEASWGESELAKFSKFLRFPTEGLEKDIADFFIKIRKRRERVHSKTLLEKSKFERELKRLKCSINYEGGKNRMRECKEEGARFWKLNEDKTVELECSWS
ncbi:hypothetical protein PVL29_025131 [Vitis rotundifolia]|uniref:DUF4283 domain-containing protein n=1 Tax=Vitis rotundifolia TaxID=103349 RepID=A0AA39DAM6_VITRO|nr:hypothetical protein PVL29_025131 [Vitis rotundifolia]